MDLDTGRGPRAGEAPDTADAEDTTSATSDGGAPGDRLVDAGGNLIDDPAGLEGDAEDNTLDTIRPSEPNEPD